MPDYRIDLDARNPGQFFACCGLFELAELVAPGGLASFAPSGDTFVLSTGAQLDGVKLELSPSGAFEDKTLEPLAIAFADRTLDLAWWLNDTRTDKSALKTWGGQQTPRRVLLELLEHLNPDTPLKDAFGYVAYLKSRFGVDARSAWDALDAGYSPNDIGQSAATFPWVEVLAVIGLQGFRPQQQTRRSLYRYATWAQPLPIAVARAASAAPWTGVSARAFEFRMVARGQGYKTFSFAKGVSHDASLVAI